MWLPILLFAYREVPQASTGFSPFELFYGWDVHGPLDLFRITWKALASCTSDCSVVQYILEIRDRLAKYRDEAEVNLHEARQLQKVWYRPGNGSYSLAQRFCFIYKNLVVY